MGKIEEKESYGLEEIQAILLDALTAYDNICRKNEICYSLHGGTLLGAERNHKFIPWDDDIDVSMKRSEYKKFRDISERLPEGFELDEKTMWFPRLVMRKDDTVAYVDILIWDYISDKRLAQKAKILLLRFWQGMMKPQVEYERFGLVNRGLLFFTHVLGRCVPHSLKLKSFHYICQNMFTGRKEAIHRSNDAFVGGSYIFDSDYMDEYTDIEFEGRYFMVNKRYHEFLERNYGEDYMIPPPESERTPGHEKFRNDL